MDRLRECRQSADASRQFAARASDRAGVNGIREDSANDYAWYSKVQYLTYCTVLFTSDNLRHSPDPRASHQYGIITWE